MNHHLLPLRTVSRSAHRLYRWVLLATLTMASPVWALNCNWIAGNPTATPESLSVNISNNGIAVEAGVDVLSIYDLAEFQTPTSFSGSVYTCSAGTNYSKAVAVGGSTTLATGGNGRIGYLTNVPGVGVQILSNTLLMPPSPAVSSTPLLNGAWYYYNGAGYGVTYRFFRVDGQRMGTGLVDGASLPQVQQYEGDLLMFTARAVGQLKIVGLSCNVSNVSVNLGTATLAQFKGYALPISSAPVPFAINATNCPAGMDTVSVSLSPTAGFYNSGIAALTPDSTATGVGIQILDNNGNPVAFNTDYPMPYNGATGGNVQQNFAARYYQVAQTITSGTANTTLTYTMNYQ